MRIPYDEIVVLLAAILRANGFSKDRAVPAAELFADASRDGVQSHGLNRFPGFVTMVCDGYVKPEATPTLVEQMGAVERWDGNLGPGVLNAHQSMDRATELAREHTIGVVGLRNTNHWMRGANYGWQAAEAGCLGICWTNTEPNMAPWGGDRHGVGNNPLVIAVPRSDGHVVLDMAMSQFAYGRLGNHARSGEPLPVAGGVDSSGEPTTDAAAILDGGRVLPMGYWKGSGLALMLDLIAALVSGGKTTRDIADLEPEHSVSQVFAAIDLSGVNQASFHEAVVERAVEFVLAAGEGEAAPRYPGQATLSTRRDSGKNGVYVADEVWQRIKDLAPDR
ncbi:MAG: 3-dehydro-L-gulonate 2-dehydrogenase [Spirochaetales bacterium]|nr:3-dehydro-L-gulonate 2-dehydrogenase [Spirochaetales bacterium]